MRRIGALLLLLLLLVVGCSFSGPDGGGGPDGGPGRDGDAEPDAPGPCVSWSSRAGHVPMTCDLPAGPAWTVTSNTTFNTTNGTYTEGAGPTGMEITQTGGGQIRVISVASFTVAPSATLRVVGSRPLLVLSWSTINVAGIIDVSSVRSGSMTSLGAGANRMGCDTGDNGQGNQDSGGGGGGGFHLGGGKGGNGDGGNTNGGPGGGSTPRPAIVVGGCRGGNGGSGSSAGQAGASGGAIQLTAKVSIQLTDTAQISAGGMGGQGGQGDGGGGGGGAGGFIGLDAPTVTTISGALLASNGGGGGTGCDGNTGPNGANGNVGTARAPGGPAAVCSNAVAGGRGGALGTPIEMAGEDGVNSQSNGTSAGGGGGGVGYIVVWAGTLQFQGIASPAHVLVP